MAEVNWHRLDRTVQEAYARTLGYFWLPCPTCGEMFGGHEIGDGSVRDPDNPGKWRVICKACTAAGKGEG